MSGRVIADQNVASVKEYAVAFELDLQQLQNRRDVFLQLRIIRPDTRLAHRERDCTVHRTGIRVVKAQLFRETARDGGFAGAAGPSIATMGRARFTSALPHRAAAIE